MSHLNLHKTYPSNNVTRRRTHLKPSQVAVLQESFVTNTLPDATMRAQLARDLGVSERTVQIWFQNRRAKARKLESLSPGGSATSLVPNVRTGWVEMPTQLANNNNNQQSQQHQPQQFQATFRSFVTPECYESEPSIKRRPRSSSKPEKTTTSRFMLPSLPQRAMSEGMNQIEANSQDNQPKSLVTFPVNTIRIGSWARFASQIPASGEWDLVCFSDPNCRQLIWQVQDDGHQFRIEVDYQNIVQIRLGQIHADIGELEIELVNNPNISFSMRRHDGDFEWVRCGDFTESQQASSGERSHALQGLHDNLRQSLLELISQAPDLAAKLLIIPDHFAATTTSNSSINNSDYFARELTNSPTVTPEPSFATSNYHNHTAWMMDPIKNSWNNNSFYTTAAVTNDGHQQSYDETTHWTYLNMLQQQSNNNNQNILNSFI